MDQYEREELDLQIRYGQIRAELWRLERVDGADPRIPALKDELAKNRARLRAIEYLMERDEAPDTADWLRGLDIPRSLSHRSAPAAETGP